MNLGSSRHFLLVYETLHRSFCRVADLRSRDENFQALYKFVFEMNPTGQLAGES